MAYDELMKGDPVFSIQILNLLKHEEWQHYFQNLTWNEIGIIQNSISKVLGFMSMKNCTSRS